MNFDFGFVLLVILLPMVRQVVSADESHYDTYTYYTTVTQLSCVQRSSQNCGGWWLGRHCWDTYWNDCHVVYSTILQIGTKCQTGWSSLKCNVPICSTPCIDGKVCTSPNTCQCVTTGGGCQAVPCSADVNCYPGSCASNPACSCPSGFSGPNCINIDKTPDISSCQVQLYSNLTRAIFRTVACESTGIEPRNTAWIGRESIWQIQVTWTTNYVQPFSLPSNTFAPHVSNAPVTIGVSETGFSVSTGGNPAGAYTLYPIANGPQGTVNGNLNKPFSDYGITPSDSQTLKVTVSSKLGGQKIGANSPSIPGSSFPAQVFNGVPITRSTLFQFDLTTPVHCLSNPNNECLVFAIYLDEDITTVSTIQPKVYNWTDQGSGIMNFHFEVFFMQPNVDNLLVNAQGIVFTNDIAPGDNNFAFTCAASGVYSIELTVQDQAGNSAKARKLLIFNKDSVLKTYPENPVYVREADPNTGYNWITKFDDPKNGGNIMLTLTWSGHFSSNAQFDNSWGLAAVAWTSGIDDRYKDRYGRRTISALDNMPSGIGAYGVAFIVDPTDGGKGLIPLNWIWLNATVSSYALPISSLTDGSTIVVWLQCSDVAGATVTEKLMVKVDRSTPVTTEAVFSAYGIDESTSSVSIKTSDKASGILQISFSIYDSKLKNLIHSGVSAPAKRQQPPPQNRRKKRLVQPCTANDTTCYCIPSGDCYNYDQVVEVDNCWLDRLAGHTFEFRFTVTNGANTSSIEQIVQLGELSLNCRTGVPVAGIVVGCVLGLLLLVALIIIVVLVIRVYVCGKPAPARLRVAGKTVRDKFSSLRNDRPQLDENIVYSGSNDYRPNNLDRQKNGFKEEDFNPSKAKQSHGAKAAKLQEETYVYNDLNPTSNSPGGGKIISNKDLDLGEIISEGRFAVVRQGRLSQGRENFPVATKSLKRGFMDADVKLMEEKIALLSRLPRSAFLVEYLGRLEGDRDIGLVIVLEYCDMTLKDWLKDISKVNSDVLEEMLNFTSNIANGMKFLHENDVIHRRLGARNVLLKSQGNGHVAKIIGFGPNREDRDGERTSVPIKWLAPETLQTFQSGSPTYDRKTDTWAFAITTWEIFSKGEAPYPGLSSDQVKDLLMKKNRMVLTCPENCSQQLFKSVVMPCWNFKPKQRPDFSEICSRIDTFRRGSEEPTEGYYPMISDIRPEDQYEQSPEFYNDAR